MLTLRDRGAIAHTAPVCKFHPHLMRSGRQRRIVSAGPALKNAGLRAENSQMLAVIAQASKLSRNDSLRVPEK